MSAGRGSQRQLLAVSAGGCGSGVPPALRWVPCPSPCAGPGLPLSPRLPACVSGYHTVQRTYGCELLEDGGIWGFLRDAYDGKDFIAFDKDTLTFVMAYAAALITKRKWEAENEPERLKHYLEKSCMEWQWRYMEYRRAALERRGEGEAGPPGHGDGPRARCYGNEACQPP